MNRYDIILFENFHLAFNHKYDVVLMASLLRHAGSNVAILDIYGEDKEDEKEGIPVIHLPDIGAMPDDKWNKCPKNRLYSLFATIRFLWQQHVYMKKVLSLVKDKADIFYCGSYHMLMPSAFMKLSKPCYYWGLRSSRMSCFWKHFKKNPLLAFRMIYLKRKFSCNVTQKLLVSNEIIKEEFVRLGISENRLVIREERCIKDISQTNMDKLSTQCTFLTIGMLRPEKQIERTIQVYKSACLEDSRLLLVGKSTPQYEVVMEESIDGDKRIVRVNEYLDYEIFNSYITQSHFVVFADRQQASSITNGTMLEALINYRPIIAPNYNPYAYYIKKYHIGILYDSEDRESFQKALEEAVVRGCKYFIPAISRYLQTILFEKVSADLYQAVMNKK